jgi:hypothetical protein
MERVAMILAVVLVMTLLALVAAWLGPGLFAAASSGGSGA